MKRIVILSLVLLLPVLAEPAAADAPSSDRPTRCGGPWIPERQECSLVYDGGSVGVGLTLMGTPIGTAVVRLERNTKVEGVRRVILLCRASGQASACGASMTSSEPLMPRGTPLLCTVEGRLGFGSYGCSSDST